MKTPIPHLEQNFSPRRGQRWLHRCARPAFAAAFWLAALSPSYTPAATQTWDNTSSDSIWGTSLNWLPGPSAWTDGNDAVFGATGAGTVSLNAAVSVHNQTFNAAGYIIEGAGNPLTLDGTTPTITVNAPATNATSIYGTNGLTIQGTSVLTLQGNSYSGAGNYYTGGTYIKSGTVILQADYALANGTAYAIDSVEALDTGATLVIPGAWDGVGSATSTRDQIAENLPGGSRLNMTGGTLDFYNDKKNQRVPIPEGTGLIINTGPNIQSGLQAIMYGADKTFAGVIADGNNGVLSTNNNLNGGPGYQIGILQLNGSGATWTLTGSNTFSGSTRIDAGASGGIKLAGNGTIGFPTPNGLTGPLRIYNGFLDLGGNNQTIALMQNGNSSGRIFNSAVGTVSTLTIGYGNEQANRSTSYQLMDNQGTGGLFALKKIITAPYLIPPAYTDLATNCVQELTGICTYSGDTTVNGGSLILSSLTAVSTNSAYRLSTGNYALLKLNYTGTNDVRQLWINGVQQPNGVYGAGTLGIDPISTGWINVTGFAPVTLGYSQSGGNLTLTWAGVYKLQSATNILGPWQDYAGGGMSPVIVPINSASGSVFFRLATY